MNLVSTNGTYLNWERLKRGSSKFEAKLRHGDIISLAAPPQHGNVILLNLDDIAWNFDMIMRALIISLIRTSFLVFEFL